MVFVFVFFSFWKVVSLVSLVLLVCFGDVLCLPLLKGLLSIFNLDF